MSWLDRMGRDFSLTRGYCDRMLADQARRQYEALLANKVKEQIFEDGWLGPEADDATFLRSIGIQP